MSLISIYVDIFKRSANLPLVFKFLMKYKANYDIITNENKNKGVL